MKYRKLYLLYQLERRNRKQQKNWFNRTQKIKLSKEIQVNPVITIKKKFIFKNKDFLNGLKTQNLAIFFTMDKLKT